MKSSIVLPGLAVHLLAATAALGGHVLNNGPGPGTVTLEVDTYGSFGASIGLQANNPVFDPAGPPAPSGTTFESGLAIRLGDSGPRTFLTTGEIGGTGGLPVSPLIGDATSASSAFSFLGLEFTLTQTLVNLVSGTDPAGSRLDQQYAIFNPGAAAVALDIVRYFDGELSFGGGGPDGGGLLFLSGTDVLFETDAAVAANQSTTYVAITGEGGTAPGSGRYAIDEYDSLLSGILSGNALSDQVFGDADLDQFIDAGAAYDVALALRNVLLIPAGETVVYTTRTIFGSGAPADTPPLPTVPPQPPVIPEPGTIFAGAFVGLLAFGAWRRRRS